MPLELIDHVEVVLGAGSVLYGSNAMLGIVNVVTKRAKDFTGARVFAERARSPRSYRGIGAGLGYEFPLFGASAVSSLAAAEYYTQDGPNFTFAEQAFHFRSIHPEADALQSQPRGWPWGGEAVGTYYSARSERAPALQQWGSSRCLCTLLTFKTQAPYSSKYVESYADFGRTLQLSTRSLALGRFSDTT